MNIFIDIFFNIKTSLIGRLAAGVFGVGYYIYGNYYMSYNDNKKEKNDKKTLSSLESLKKEEFISLIKCLQKIYLENLERTHILVYFVRPSMIVLSEKKFSVIPLKSHIILI